MAKLTPILTQVTTKNDKTDTRYSVRHKFFLLVFLTLGLSFDLVVRQPNSNLLDNQYLLEVPAQQ